MMWLLGVVGGNIRYRSIVSKERENGNDTSQSSAILHHRVFSITHFGGRISATPGGRCDKGMLAKTVVTENRATGWRSHN
jgi:hypothetical protein